MQRPPAILFCLQGAQFGPTATLIPCDQHGNPISVSNSSCLRIFDVTGTQSPRSDLPAAHAISSDISLDRVALTLNSSSLTAHNVIPAIANFLGLQLDYIGVGYFANSPINGKNTFLVAQGEEAAA